MIFRKNDDDGLYNKSYFSHPEDDFINTINENGDEFDLRILFTILSFVALVSFYYSFYYSFTIGDITSSIVFIILGCIAASPLVYSIIYCYLINSYKKSQLVIFKILISDPIINELTRENVYSEEIEKAVKSYIVELSETNVLLNNSKVIYNKLFLSDFLMYKKIVEDSNLHLLSLQSLALEQMEHDKRSEKLAEELLNNAKRSAQSMNAS